MKLKVDNVVFVVTTGLRKLLLGTAHVGVMWSNVVEETGEPWGIKFLKYM